MVGLIKAQISAQRREVARKRVKQGMTRIGGRVTGSQSAPELLGGRREIAGLKTEGGRDAQQVVRRRTRLPVYVAIELLPVQPDLATEIRNRNARAAGILEIGIKFVTGMMIHADSVKPRKDASSREIA